MSPDEKVKLGRMAGTLLADEAFAYAVHQIEKSATEDLISAATDDIRREKSADVRAVRRVKSQLSVMAQWAKGKDHE